MKIVQRGELVADAFGEGGTALDEEGTVSAEAGGIGFELGDGEAESEEVVEALEGEGGVGRAAAETRAEGDALVEADMHRRQVGEVGFEEAVGLEAKVVGGVGVEGEAGDSKTSSTSGTSSTRRYLQVVVEEGDGEEDGLEVVVAVGALPQDAEAEVNLAWRV